MMNKALKDRLLWLGFAFAFLVVSSAFGYIAKWLSTVSTNQQKLMNVQENQAKKDRVNSRQWQKLSELIERTKSLETGQKHIYSDVQMLKGQHIK